jgi:Rrf2 family nitric oxide-sensitive transcriptional repressor
MPTMISQTAEYALRAVVHLACNTGSPQTNRQISESTLVPMPYLSKVLQGMARAGLVHSVRGIHGGFSLARSPEDMTVYQIIQSVDPLTRITSCPLGLKAHGVNLCPLHRRLDNAMALVEQAFKDSTIADILAEPTTSKPLCSISFAEAAGVC